MRSPVPAVLAILLVVTLASGCGGDDTKTTSTAKSDATTGGAVSLKVVSEYAAIGSAIYQIGDAYGRATRDAASWPEGTASKYFQDLARTTRKVSRGLQDSTPVKSETIMRNRAEVVTGLKNLAADLDDLAAAGRTGDPEAAKAAAARIRIDAADVNTPLNALTDELSRLTPSIPAPTKQKQKQ